MLEALSSNSSTDTKREREVINCMGCSSSLLKPKDPTYSHVLLFIVVSELLVALNNHD
jgi:Ni,Fe-hydrogenase I small subunit